MHHERPPRSLDARVRAVPRLSALTGAAADKAKAAALEKYAGTVERVMKLADGSYVVHVLRSAGGEVHGKVSKAFAVTGSEQGPPAGAPPATGSGTTQS